MKLTKKFLLASAIATAVSASTSWAGGKEGGADPAPAVEEPAAAPDEGVVVDDSTVIDGKDVDADGNQGEVIEEGGAEGVDTGEEITIRTLDDGAVEKGEVTEGEPIELVDPPMTFEPGGPEVQRGDDKGLNPEVIFQTTALGGGAVGNPEARTEAGFGSDERAAEIEAKGSRISAVKSQKKGPVALVKKGRVFLR